MVKPPNRFQARVINWLLSLDLSDFEQTTHGRLGANEIEDVAAELVRAYRDPRALNISNLQQAIRGLAKSEKQ